MGEGRFNLVLIWIFSHQLVLSDTHVVAHKPNYDVERGWARLSNRLLTSCNGLVERSRVTARARPLATMSHNHNPPKGM